MIGSCRFFSFLRCSIMCFYKVSNDVPRCSILFMGFYDVLGFSRLCKP